MLITSPTPVTQKNRYSLQYSQLLLMARLVISDPMSYDPLFRFVRLQTFVSWSSTPFYIRDPLAIAFARAHSVWQDARSRAKSLSLFIDLQPAKNSEIKLALNFKTFDVNCLTVILADQRMHWIVKIVEYRRTY